METSEGLAMEGPGQDNSTVQEIIAKVQGDLQYLHAATLGLSGASVDLETLKMVLGRTEKGMQTVAERFLHSANDNVTTLPTVARKVDNIQSESEKYPKTRHRRSHSAGNVELSTGQFCLVEHMSQLVSQPANPLTHRMLTDYYDLPTKEFTTLTDKPLPGQLLVGTTVDQLTTLPRSNRRDPLLTPPPISQTDACKGLLSLVERGLIPPAAEIVLSPPPVQPQSLRLHTPSKQHIPQKISDGVTAQLTGIKLDSKPISIQIPTVSKSHSLQEIPTTSLKTLYLPDTKDNLEHQSIVVSDKKLLANYKVVIQNGYVVDKTNDFMLFRKDQHHKWEMISKALKAIVGLCKNYAIPLCIVDGNSLVHLAQECELGLKPTKEALLAVIMNKKDVQSKLFLLGQRYRGADGKHAAATKIKATYLMFKERKKYLDYRRRKWAAGILSMAWLMFMKLDGIRQKLKLLYITHLETHRYQTAELRKRWNTIQSSKRTIIHMASQGYSQHVRVTIPDFHIEQSLQMGRLCDIQDPNVEIVYVSPTPITQEVTDYYCKLADMGPAGRTSRERFQLVFPENYSSFKNHNLSLASLVLYSPACLSRIKRLITGKEAYMVSGIVSKDDLALAYELGVPLLGSEPDISHLYSTKAGARHLLGSSKVIIPPYKSDIVSQDQLMEALATLIANNLFIQRWIFKMPEQVRGSGFAYCDIIRHLPCYDWVAKEAKRYGPKWTKPWAQESAINKISSYLPDILSKHAHVVDTALYPSWAHFLMHFLQLGGLVEGAPPSDSITPLAVDVLIEPTGQVKVLCTYDQIWSGEYKVCGGTVPQTSVPHSQLMSAVSSVAEECQSRGILGHLSMDFLTFIDPVSLCQTLWCVDLDLGYSNNLALYRLMNYLTGCLLDVNSGALISSETEVEHYAVLAPRLYHSNLSLYYYSIFFQMCKAHFIGFDPDCKLGTIFNLADDRHKEYLGMISIHKTLIGAVQTSSSNLSIIHQEISTTNMQGSSNFKAISKELDKVIDLINFNR